VTVDLGRDGPLAVHMLPPASSSSASSTLEGAVVKAGLGVLLQLLGQVGAGRAAAGREDTVLVIILRSLLSSFARC